MTRREILYFAGGAAVGGMVAWLLTKYHYEHLVIEVEGSESYIPGNEDKTLPGPEEDVKNDAEPEKERVWTNYKAPAQEELEKLAIKYRSDYWDNPPEFNAEDGWEEGDSEYPREEPADKPYPISEEQYSEDHTEDYTKAVLYYHGGDGTIIEEGIPFEKYSHSDIEDGIGWENINLIKEKLKDARLESEKYGTPLEDVMLYFRNERLHIDYLIIADPDSYGGELLGTYE